MDISLNNILYAQQLITMNNIPTIVNIPATTNGNKARLEILLGYAGHSTTEEYYITINDATVTSSIEEKNAKGSVFWLSGGLSLAYARSQAYYLTLALQNTSLANNYNIYMDGLQYNTNQTKVIVEAKECGRQYNFTNVNSNIPNWTFTIKSEGSSNDLLTNSKIVLTIEAATEQSEQTEIGANGITLPQIVQLEKNYNKDGISFDISPVLSNITEDGKLTQYNVRANYISNGQYIPIGELTHNYAVNGYYVNQGLMYIPKFNGMFFAQNVNRGKDKSTYNNTILYYINNHPITMSFYVTTMSEKTLTINYLDSALNTIQTTKKTYNPTKSLDTMEFIPENEDAYYIDVVVQNVGTVRYQNVKPDKYVNDEDVHTIYWFNEYGGISFAPFTFSKLEERQSEVTKYKQQSFNIYKDDYKVLNQVYNRELEYSVELKTHYIPKDATWLFYSLLHSYNAWTYVNDVKYAIIVTDVQVNETSTNDIYQVTVKYEYSVPDNFR